jgi:hypothetical protein
MVTILTIINTAILIILFGDRVREIIKEKILDKTDLDEKLVAAIKDLMDKIKNKK